MSVALFFEDSIEPSDEEEIEADEDLDVDLFKAEAGLNPFWDIIRTVCHKHKELKFHVVPYLDILENEMSKLESKGTWITCKEEKQDQKLSYNSLTHRIVFHESGRKLQQLKTKTMHSNLSVSTDVNLSRLSYLVNTPSPKKRKGSNNVFAMGDEIINVSATETLEPQGHHPLVFTENLLGFKTHPWHFSDNDVVDVYRAYAARRDHKSFLPSEASIAAFPEYFSQFPIPPNTKKLFANVCLRSGEVFAKTKVLVDYEYEFPSHLIEKTLKKLQFKKYFQDLCKKAEVDFSDHSQYLLKCVQKEEYFWGSSNHGLYDYAYTRQCLTNETSMQLKIFHVTERAPELIKAGNAIAEREKTFGDAYAPRICMDSFLSRWQFKDVPRNTDGSQLITGIQNALDLDSLFCMRFIKVTGLEHLGHLKRYSNLFLVAEVWVGVQQIMVLEGPNFDSQCNGFAADQWLRGSLRWNELPCEATICLMVVCCETGCNKKHVIGWTRFPIMDPRRRLVKGEYTFNLWHIIERVDDNCEFKKRGVTRPLTLKNAQNVAQVTIAFEDHNDCDVFVPLDPYAGYSPRKIESERKSSSGFDSLVLTLNLSTNIAKRGVVNSKIFCPETFSALDIIMKLQKTKKFKPECLGLDPNLFIIRLPGKYWFFSGRTPLSKYPCLQDHTSIELEVHLMSDMAVEPLIQRKIASVANISPLEGMKPQMKRFVFEFRHQIQHIPAALAVFVGSVDWLNTEEVMECRRMLDIWKPGRPEELLELLDYRYQDSYLRNWVVRQLDENMDDATLAQFLLELVQCLKFEIHHSSALSDFLIRRALANPYQVGNILFWHLKAEYHDIRYCERFGLIMEEYLLHSGAVAKELNIAQNLIDQLGEIAQETCHNFWKTNMGKPRVNLRLRERLAQLNTMIPEGIRPPLFPTCLVNQLVVEECRCMTSKKVPLWLEFNNVDSDGKPIKVMFKSGDDLRQDMLTLQIFKIMELDWLNSKLHLPLKPYSCISTGLNLGFLEIVEKSDTLNDINEKYGGARGAFKDSNLVEFINSVSKNEKDKEERIQMFTRSCAGYMIATYVLGVGDRHPDNFMMQQDGRFFHIDFGHFLGNFKTKFGWKRERVPLVLSGSMKRVLDSSSDKNNFEAYKKMCTAAYRVLRRRHRFYANLFRLMLPAEMPELLQESDIEYLITTLHMEKRDDEVEKHLNEEIENSLNEWYRVWDWYLHHLKNPK